MTETLILNANTTNTKQLSGPEKLPGLSRNKLLARHLELFYTIQQMVVYLYNVNDISLVDIFII